MIEIWSWSFMFKLPTCPCILFAVNLFTFCNQKTYFLAKHMLSFMRANFHSPSSHIIRRTLLQNKYWIQTLVQLVFPQSTANTKDLYWHTKIRLIVCSHVTLGFATGTRLMNETRLCPSTEEDRSIMYKIYSTACCYRCSNTLINQEYLGSLVGEG